MPPTMPSEMPSADAVRALRVNRARLWDSIMAMAKIGATAAGGSCRLALTDEDRAGRALFTEWCRAAGCDIRVDQLGNLFARYPGRDPARRSTWKPAPMRCCTRRCGWLVV